MYVPSLGSVSGTASSSDAVAPVLLLMGMVEAMIVALYEVVGLRNFRGIDDARESCPKGFQQETRVINV